MIKVSYLRSLIKGGSIVQVEALNFFLARINPVRSSEV